MTTYHWTTHVRHRDPLDMDPTMHLVLDGGTNEAVCKGMGSARVRIPWDHGHQCVTCLRFVMEGLTRIFSEVSREL